MLLWPQCIWAFVLHSVCLIQINIHSITWTHIHADSTVWGYQVLQYHPMLWQCNPSNFLQYHPMHWQCSHFVGLCPRRCIHVSLPSCWMWGFHHPGWHCCSCRLVPHSVTAGRLAVGLRSHPLPAPKNLETSVTANGTALLQSHGQILALERHRLRQRLNWKTSWDNYCEVSNLNNPMLKRLDVTSSEWVVSLVILWKLSAGPVSDLSYPTETRPSHSPIPSGNNLSW